MGYDSGIKRASEPARSPGCTAQHEAEGDEVAADSDVGYYAPLKENTNRFVKRGR